MVRLRVPCRNADGLLRPVSPSTARSSGRKLPPRIFNGAKSHRVVEADSTIARGPGRHRARLAPRQREIAPTRSGGEPKNSGATGTSPCPSSSATQNERSFSKFRARRRDTLPSTQNPLPTFASSSSSAPIFSSHRLQRKFHNTAPPGATH